MDNGENNLIGWLMSGGENQKRKRMLGAKLKIEEVMGKK